MNQIAIALSVVLSFLSTEFLGLLSGGMISAGYLSLYIQSPFRIVITLCCSVLVFGSIRLLEKFTIIYGRRRFMACVLIGFVFVWLWGLIVPSVSIGYDVRIIGFIIPGLIANDMLKQGVWKTLLSLVFLTLLTSLLTLLILAVF